MMSDFTPLYHAVLALTFVLGLIWLCAAAARRFAPNIAMAGKGRRLQVLEVAALDTRHRAVLLRCDAREHLIIVGEGSTCIVDRAIPAATSAPQETPS